jgi:hypothetical protein
MTSKNALFVSCGASPATTVVIATYDAAVSGRMWLMAEYLQ